MTVAAAASLFLSIAVDPASARTVVPGSGQERKPAAMQIAAACGGKQDCAATIGGGANADTSRGAGATRSGGAAGDAGSRRGCGSGLR